MEDLEYETELTFNNVQFHIFNYFFLLGRVHLVNEIGSSDLIRLKRETFRGS